MRDMQLRKIGTETSVKNSGIRKRDDTAVPNVPYKAEPPPRVPTIRKDSRLDTTLVFASVGADL